MSADAIVRVAARYGLLSVMLATVYVAVVVTVGAAADAAGARSSVPVAAATLAATLAFAPLRLVAQRAIDRRFDRRAWEAVRRVDDAARRLRDGEIDTAEMEHELRIAVGDPSLSVTYVLPSGDRVDHRGAPVAVPASVDEATALANSVSNTTDLRGVHVAESVRCDPDRVMRGKARITSATQTGRDTIALVKSGVLTKTSVGYEIHKVIEQTTVKGKTVERELDGVAFEGIRTRAHETARGDVAAVWRALFGEDLVPLAAWTFLKAFPVRWATADLTASDDRVLVDTLELAAQGEPGPRGTQGSSCSTSRRSATGTPSSSSRWRRCATSSSAAARA